MASGSFNIARTGGSTYCSYRVEWSSTSKGSAVNGSVVSVWVYVDKSSSSNANTNGTTNTTVTVGDWSQSENGFKFDVAPGGSTLLFAKAYDYVGHNADGTKSITISVSIGGNIVSASGSQTVTLDTIPRKSTGSVSNGTIGGTSTITINRAASSFTHTLTYSFGNLSGTIATKTSSTSIPWTIPDSFYTQIPNATAGQGGVWIETFSGSTSIGKNGPYYFTAYENSNVTKPTLNPTIVDQGSVSKTLTGNTSKIIKGYNTVNITFNAVAQKSSTITSKRVTCGNKSRTSDGILEYVDNKTFNFSVTDSRGHTVTKTVTIPDSNWVEYIPLTCGLSANPTLSGDNTATISVNVYGNYFDGSFGAVDNSLGVEYRYKINDGEYPEEWTELTATPTNGKYTATDTISGLSYKDTCTIQARAKDAIYTGYINVNEQVIKIDPVFDWGKNDFNFNVPVHGAGGFTYDIPIMTSGDCNAITTSGKYYIGTSGSNKPDSGLNGWLECKKYSTDYCHQVYTTYQGVVYRRIMQGGTWSEWYIDEKNQLNWVHISSLRTNGAGIYFMQIANPSSGSYYIHTATNNMGSFGANVWSSDKRLKSDIEESNVEALSVIDSIKHRSFSWINNGAKNNNGYIAQELEELNESFVIKVPDTRFVNGKMYFTGDYSYQVDERGLIPYITKSIQELHDTIKDLKNEINTLKGGSANV